MIYYLFLAIFALIALLYRKNSTRRYKLISILFIVISTIIVGLRALSVGADTASYLRIYNNSFNFNYDNSLEIGYQLLNSLFYRFGLSYRFFLISIAFLTFTFFTIFIKKSTKLFLISIIVLIGMFFLPSMNLIRQWLALSIGINSYIYLKREKFIAALLIIVFSSLIHYSTLILLLFMPLFYFRKNDKLFITTIILISLLIIGFNTYIPYLLAILPDHYSAYIYGELFQGTSELNVKTLVYLVITIFMFYIYLKIKSTNSENDVYEIKILACMSWISFLLSIIGNQYYMIHRLAYNLNIFYVLSIPLIIINLKRFRKILYYLLILSMFIMLWFNLRNDNNGVNPYLFSDNIWEEIHE